MRPLFAATAVCLYASPAFACGGLFCGAPPSPTEPTPPVVQKAERVIFAVEDGTVEAHVQIFYEGDPIDFAWVVPVAGLPELSVGYAPLFDVLAEYTRPTFDVVFRDEGECTRPFNGGSGGGGGGGCGLSAGDDTAALAGGDTATPWPSDDNGVVVVEQARVGPFETVTLTADSPDALVAWLQDNDYSVPDTLVPLLGPYTAQGSHFVALRLQNDATAGDIAPIVMRYPGDRGSIPIQLTAVAAAPELPLEVYVSGEPRAVPDNYHHVVVDHAAVDWLTAGANYPAVLSRAADQAGGKAFATDFSGDPIAFRVRLPELPSGSDAEDRAVRDRAYELLTMPHLTRLSSAMSADEMTLDPTFVLNADMDQQVDNVHEATVTWDCRGDRLYATAPRDVAMPDGRHVYLPSQSWLADNDLTTTEFLDQTDFQPLRIEDAGADGAPEVLVDNTLEVSPDALDASNDVARLTVLSGPVLPRTGSGCASVGRVTGAWLLLGVLLGLRRRTTA